MPNLKMSGATPSGNKSLCYTCKHSIVVKGINCEEAILCNEAFYKNGATLVPFRVAECTMFQNRNHPEKYEMEKIAWSVEARRRGPVGFDQCSNEMDIVITEPKKKDDND